MLVNLNEEDNYSTKYNQSLQFSADCTGITKYIKCLIVAIPFHAVWFDYFLACDEKKPSSFTINYANVVISTNLRDRTRVLLTNRTSQCIKIKTSIPLFCEEFIFFLAQQYLGFSVSVLTNYSWRFERVENNSI